jgi:hypothetical protein
MKAVKSLYFSTPLHCTATKINASNITITATTTNNHAKHVAQTNHHLLHKFFLFGYRLPYLGRFHPPVVCIIIFVERVAQDIINNVSEVKNNIHRVVA